MGDGDLTMVQLRLTICGPAGGHGLRLGCYGVEVDARHFISAKTTSSRQ